MARSNKTRIRRARAALLAYAGPSDDDDAATGLVDLLTDAAHLLGREQVERCTRIALAHYDTEERKATPEPAPQAPRDTIGAMDYAYEDDTTFDAEGRL